MVYIEWAGGGAVFDSLRKRSDTQFECRYRHPFITGSFDINRVGSNCSSPREVYNSDIGECFVPKGPPDDSLNCQGPSKSQGNPLDISLGNKFQSETDYSMAGGLGFIRYYNSIDGRWRHGYSSRVDASSWRVVVAEATGREINFTKPSSAMTLPLVRLTQASDAWLLDTPKGRSYFDLSGKLLSQQLSSGLLLKFVYTNDGAVHVADERGHSLKYTQDSNGKLTKLEAEGVFLFYEYSEAGQLTAVKGTVHGISKARNYFYGDVRNPSLLTGISDERGVRYATWTYDESGRAISSEHADGADRIEVTYNDDGSSTVTNELGKKATYHFQTIQGIKRITAIEGEPSPNCPNSNSTFTYDDRGLLKTKTDNKGIVTTYDYNERGLEVSRTEASGTAQARTVTTEWHPSLYLPLAVTEPDRITRFQYDDQGRQLSRTVENR